MIRSEGSRRVRVHAACAWSAAVAGVLAALLAALPALAAPLVTGLGGARDFGESAVAPSDDGSSAAIDITPVFGPAGLNFFGTSFSTVYVNTNGNLTFAAPLAEFTPFGIPTSHVPIIAAFFADADTRGGGQPAGSNTIYYDLDTTNRVFTATWDLVSYFAGHADKRNSFQIRLIDRGSGDFDVEWRYERLEWTTGDASGGSGGLGGTPARAGYAKGNGGTFLEFPESGNQAAMLDLVNQSNVRDAGRFAFTVRGGQVFFCGNGERELSEECDPQAAASGCQGTEVCRPDCTCGPCGNNTLDAGEECDGTAEAACPGRCIGASLAGECACAPAREEACTGDCDLSGAVTGAEAAVCEAILAGTQPLTACRQCDADVDGSVSRGEAGKAMARVTSGCADLGICGNGVIENVEECDDGGTCVGGPAAGQICDAAADCQQGACVAFGGDGCAANCTPESDVIFDLVTGQVTPTGAVPGTSVLESRAGVLVGSPPPVTQTLAFPANGRMVLTIGKPRSGQRPVAVRASSVKTTASLDGFAGGVCACTRALEDAAAHGPGNAASGVIDCLGLAGVDATVTVTAGQGTSVVRAGQGAPGSARLTLKTELTEVFGQCFGQGGAWGPDEQFCTADDGVPSFRSALSVELSTGTIGARVVPQNGQGIGPFAATGASFDCATLTTGKADGAAFGLAAALAIGGSPSVPYSATVVSGVLVAGPSTCGDGTLDAGEECDDGNTRNGDCCSSTCALDVYCTDGNPCTSIDTCTGLTCVGGPPTDCSDGNPCSADRCEPAFGCISVLTPGEPCDDGNACTTDDTCAGPQCAGTPVDCSDSDPCTTEKCVPTQGCQYPPTTCADGNPCTLDTCDPASGCAFPPSPAGRPCNDNLFCNGVDTCNGAGQCDHKGDPCLGTECSFCRERTDKLAGFCNTPAETRCTDERDATTAADKCDGVGYCRGRIPTSVFAIIGPLAPAPRSPVVLGTDAMVQGHVCVESLDARVGARIQGDAVAIPPTGVAARFSGTKIDQNLVTGGAEYRGRVTIGGRKDTTGTGIELADCLHAISDASARVAALVAKPATLKVPALRIDARTAGTLPATGALPAGEVIVDVEGDLRVGSGGTLQLTSGTGTTRVVLRVKGRLLLDPGALVTGDANLPQARVLVIVDKEASIRRDAKVAGSVVARKSLRAVSGGTIDGQLIFGEEVKLYRNAKVTGVTYGGW